MTVKLLDIMTIMGMDLEVQTLMEIPTVHPIPDLMDRMIAMAINATETQKLNATLLHGPSLRNIVRIEKKGSAKN